MAKIQWRVRGECTNKARRKCAWNRIGNTMLRLHCTWGGGRGGGRWCTINVNIEWCGKWASNWMQFKHLSLERERETNASPCCSCASLGAILPRLADGVKFQVRGRPRCICHMCVQTSSASSALSLLLLPLWLPQLMIMSWDKADRFADLVPMTWCIMLN